MRQKRAKTYKKLMELYSRSFGFRQPYQVLVDSSFCTYATQNKIDIPKQLGAVLQGQQKQMITQCSMVELYKLGPTYQSVVDIAKTFERRKCNHRDAIPNDECIQSVVGDTNKHRYVIATQSQSLRTTLRAIPSVPIVHINRVVMVLEPPSDTTLRSIALKETEAQSARPTELAVIAATAPKSETNEPPRKKRKGPKEPNPLSVKKKKPQTSTPAAHSKPSTSKVKQVDDRTPSKHSGARSQQESQSKYTETAGHKRKREMHDSGDTMGRDSEATKTPALNITTNEPGAVPRTPTTVAGDIIDRLGSGDAEFSRGRKKKRKRKGASMDTTTA